MRGDVPRPHLHSAGEFGFSPRARGCSGITAMAPLLPVVFPACAGMFRVLLYIFLHTNSFPRVRGDVPLSQRPCGGREAFSPRARGCSELAKHQIKAILVFPACAGMFLCSGLETAVPVGFPRVRGDVPPFLVSKPPKSLFSPRARGCSAVATGGWKP